MFNIPMLSFFSYPEMVRMPGLYQIVSGTGWGEMRSESIVFHLIGQALTLRPLDPVLVNFDHPQQNERLIEFLNGRGINQASIIPVRDAQQCRQTMMRIGRERVAGIFIFSNMFFRDPGYDDADAPIGGMARALRSFFHHHRGEVIVTYTQSRRASFNGGDTLIRTPIQTDYLSNTTIVVEDERNNNSPLTKIRVSKSRTNNLGLILSYQVIRDRWIPETAPGNKNDFFILKADPQALVIVKPGDLLASHSTIEEFFKHHKTSKTVKKRILERSITRGEAIEDKYILNITYGMVNLYETLKTGYGSEFNPDIFINATKLEKNYCISQQSFKNYQKELVQLMNLFEQSKVYAWFEESNHGLLLDSLRALQVLNEKQVAVEFNANPKDIYEIHEELTELCELHDVAANKPVAVQENIKHWHEFKFKLEQEEKESDFFLIVPLTNREFKAMGRRMKLCIQNQWFTENLGQNNHNILIIKSEEKPEFCIEIDQRKRIVQAKANCNQEIDKFVLAQIEEMISELN